MIAGILYGVVALAVLCDVLGRRETRRHRLAECADRGCDGCFESFVRDDGVRRPCAWPVLR